MSPKSNKHFSVFDIEMGSYQPRFQSGYFKSNNRLNYSPSSSRKLNSVNRISSINLVSESEEDKNLHSSNLLNIKRFSSTN